MMKGHAYFRFLCVSLAALLAFNYATAGPMWLLLASRAKSLSAITPSPVKPMRGVPTVKVGKPSPPSNLPVTDELAGQVSKLDEVGRLARPLGATEIAKWKQELMTSNLTPQRKARLLIWLGEVQLARDEQP